MKHIRTLFAMLMLGACASNGMAIAQTGQPDKATEKKVADDVSKPVKKTKIPEKLKKVKDKPYSLKGLDRCAALQQEIRELDDVLGPDVNEKVKKSKGKKREETAGRVAGGVASGFIPFGGLIGEISGASASRRRYNRAVYAGTVRRGFLKGVGLERGCGKPARP